MIVAFIPVEWVERAAFSKLIVVSRPVKIDRREVSDRRVVPTRRAA